MMQTTFDDVSPEYKEFCEKFVVKKTTDDCYTPPAVYDAVLAWCARRYSIQSEAVVCRPFWPGGDYERYDYPPGCYVIDNPPFSIAARIVRFYMARGIRFFLFANGLTLFNSYQPGVGFVIIRHNITFENGAKVDCGFVTNLGENVLETAPDLDAAIQAVNANERHELPKYTYPNSVASSATIKRICCDGVKFSVPHGEAVLVRSLDAMGKRGIFGGGLLLSERAAAERAQAERAAACPVVKWELSQREKALQKMLSRGNTHEVGQA